MHRFGEQAWARSMCLYLSDEGQSLRNTDLSCVRAHVSVHTLVHVREHHAPSIPCEILFANELAVRGVNSHAHMCVYIDTRAHTHTHTCITVRSRRTAVRALWRAGVNPKPL